MGLRVSMKMQVGASFRLLVRVMDTDPRTLVPGVGQSGQALSGGFVERGSAVLTRGSDVVRGPRLGVAVNRPGLVRDSCSVL